jgi:prephenate dehydrogenase
MNGDREIGIIGFGRFGALMCRYMTRDFSVFVYNPSDRREAILKSGARPARFEEAAAKENVILSVPISRFQTVLDQLRPCIRPDALVMDVCSVKTFPIKWMKDRLPESVSILATHPMFGPDSAADTLKGRKIVLCRERISDGRYDKVKRYLAQKGLTLIETSAEEHDRQIAVSLALTHFIGRSLEAFGAEPLSIDTEGYNRLLHTLGVVSNDTWQLFEDMHRYNPYAGAVRREFLEALNRIHQKVTEAENRGVS